jgi:hypothetical protein
VAEGKGGGTAVGWLATTWEWWSRATSERWSRAGGGAGMPHERMPMDRGVGEAARWGPSTLPGVAVQTGLNPIQISNEFKLF